MTKTIDIRNRIVKADDIDSEIIEVPEWGNVKLKVISLSTIARTKLAQRFTKEDGTVDMERLYPQLLIATVVNPENDEPIFTDEDIDLINSKSARAVERVADLSRRLSGFGEDASQELENEAGKG